MGSSAPMTSKRPMARPSRAGSPLGGAKAPMSDAGSYASKAYGSCWYVAGFRGW